MTNRMMRTTARRDLFCPAGGAQSNPLLSINAGADGAEALDKASQFLEAAYWIAADVAMASEAIHGGRAASPASLWGCTYLIEIGSALIGAVMAGTDDVANGAGGET